MTIRTMVIDDYDKVFALWRSCEGMGLNNLDDSQEGIERFLERNPDTCFVAEEEQMIIGVILTGHDGRRGYIYHTAVLPSCRHNGIGTTLVKAASDELKAKGINKVALVVFDKNQQGNSFWEKQGFIKRDDLIYRNKTLIEMIRLDT